MGYKREFHRTFIIFLTVIIGIKWTSAVSEGQTDPGVFDRTSAMSRLILNPFGILGTPQCTVGAQEGTCYGELECLALAGTYGDFCTGFKGLCCLFYRTCNERTAQEVSYFRNKHWPIDSAPSDDCGFRIIKRDDNYCGLRVEPMDEDSESSKAGGKCGNSYLKISGIAYKGSISMCNRRANNRIYQLDMTNVKEVTLKMMHRRKILSNNWNIKVTQIRCTEFDGQILPTEEETAPPITTKQPTAPPITTKHPTAPPIVTSTSSTTTTTWSTTRRFTTMNPFITTSRPISTSWPISSTGGASPPAPPPIVTESGMITIGGGGGHIHNYAKCGVRGPERGARRTNIRGDRIEKDTNSRRRPGNKRQNIKNNGKKQGMSTLHRPADIEASSLDHLRDDSLTNTTEYAIPTLEDSLFYHYMGPQTMIALFGGNRVTYGDDAGIREFPWQVAMFANGRFHCGGSIIGDFFILTAAHCVIPYQFFISALKLSLGDFDVRSKADGEHVEAHVESISIHPDYSRTTLQNDVAVVKLKKRIEYTDRIRPICLPTTDLHLDHKYATISGWGRNRHGQLMSKLQKLKAQVKTNEVCDSRWGRNGSPNGFIVPSMMCMDSIKGDSCNGDSGGPSIFELNNSYIQVGIVSFGSGSCTDPALPGVYTRVSAYRDWIRRQMK